MASWIIAGALAAVLMAELFDAWALHRLARRCRAIQPASESEARLVHWYAEGFAHSVAMTGWLRITTLLLIAAAIVTAAHPAVIAASIVLALAAHCERHVSCALRRRFQRVTQPD